MKVFIFGLMRLLGLTRLARWVNRRHVRILCYHGVTERSGKSLQDPMGLHVRRGRFLSQLKYLEGHYHVLSLEEYVENHRQGRWLPEHSVVLTFDDGFRNFITTAAPALSKMNMPATLFLITGRVLDEPAGDGYWEPADDTRTLSWMEARCLPNGIQVGSHTQTHARLSGLSSAVAVREISISQETLRKQLPGLSEFALAYPYGDYSKRVASQARTAGYLCALTTDGRLNTDSTDLFALGRILIGDDDTLPVFAARVSGLTGWLRQALSGWRGKRETQ